MKQRLGALFCLALGAVLITSGLNAGGAGAVGDVAVQCSGVEVGVFIPCPTGTITITKTTVIPEGATVTPPVGGFKVDITSTCPDPKTGKPVDQTVTVPANGSKASTSLFVYTSSSHSTKCSYALSEQAVDGFSGVFNPVSPVELPFATNSATGNDVAVELTNTAEVPSSTPTPTLTPTPSTSEVTVTDSAPASSASAEPIAATGPRGQVRSSVYIGIALCLLGAFLLFAGSWSRRRGQHTG